jgi:uncharacterized hydrophobic protein (TIGR00271 family)
LLSVVIATTGLLLDSAATIIGAMVVTPLMGPAISASVGTVLDDPDMAARGVTLQVGGLLVSIATAALMGWLLQQTILVPPDLDIRRIPQVAERTSPNFLSLFLALGSGLAGALSVMRGAGSTLVGVAIAVAVVPPAATAGLGIAFGLPGVALAATVLVLVNLLAINLSALVLFWVSGFKPLEAGKFEGVRASVVSRIIVITLTIAVLSIALGAVTWTTYQTQTFEQRTKTELRQQVETEEIEIVSVNVDRDVADVLLGEEPVINVRVGVSRGQEVPTDLAQRWDDHLSAEFDRDVVVRIGFVEAQTSESEPPEPPLRWPPAAASQQSGPGTAAVDRPAVVTEPTGPAGSTLHVGAARRLRAWRSPVPVLALPT